MANDIDERVEGAGTSPEIFVDGYRGVQTNGQTVKVNFFSNRLEEGSIRKKAAFTMVTSMSDFIAIAQAMNEQIANFQLDGIITVVSSEEGGEA